MFLNISILLLVVYLVLLLSIAFFTLLERKILGYIHVRKGPNKVILLGLLQPVLDGVKLFIKENSIILNVRKFLYFLFPFFSLLIMIII